MIFHSYVSLPEGRGNENMYGLQENGVKTFSTPKFQVMVMIGRLTCQCCLQTMDKFMLGVIPGIQWLSQKVFPIVCA